MREPNLLFVVEAPGPGPGDPAWDASALAQAIGMPVRLEPPRGRGTGSLDPASAAVLLLPPGATPDPSGVARALEGLSGPNGPAALVDFTTTDSSGPVLLDLYLHPEGIGAVLFHADVMRACSDYYSISTDALQSKVRTKQVAHARQMAMYICRENTQASLSQIGLRFGKVDSQAHDVASGWIGRIVMDIAHFFWREFVANLEPLP